MRHRSTLVIPALPVLLAVAVVATACSRAADPTTTTTTTTTSTSTTAPIRRVRVEGVAVPEPLLVELSAVYSYAADARNEVPLVPDGLVEYLRETSPPAGTVVVDASIVELQTGEKVAVVIAGDGEVFAVEDAVGWRVVGARLGDAPPWLGASPRTLLVLGSDARVGENQLRLRADSIHLLTLVPEQSAGTILGFPRDSWVEGPDGGLKFSSLMAGRGPEIMLDTTRELTSIPIEGYVVTGFKGFDGLMQALGGLVIDLPRIMRTGNSWADFAAGLQELNPTRALQLARIRKGLPGGDFARSFNHGLIMQAAMAMVQDVGIEMLPNWLFVLLENAWTDLAAEDLLTWGAAAYYLAPEDLVNVVLPGRVGTIRGASVVFLDDEVEDIFRDLDDGILDAEDVGG